MQKTKNFDVDIEKKILLNTPELQSLLSCGQHSAVAIGKNAKARVEIGKRVLWNRQKIEEYLSTVAD